jgi:transcriptional regulator with XRE-family HTH domain
VKHHQQAKTSLKIGLGAAIRRKRTILGISQGELADRAGLHRTYVSDLERGARNPSIDSIEKLARALQLSVAKLFEVAGNGKA